MADKNEISRKDFFKDTLGFFLNSVKEFSSITNSLNQPPPPPPLKSGLFRPPGAIPEQEFLTKCSRCDKCITSCPKGALIRFERPDSINHGTPILIFRKSACVLCETFPCSSSCSTGALIMPISKSDVKIGHAVIFPNHCLSWQGSPCVKCHEICPFPDKALTLDDNNRPIISEANCVGCGLCVQNCPSPRAGVIILKNS
ncbi:MAG: 4Fe-4S dicluster domain-containing protein [Nitrospirae bacterium]|nr:4Fe-4S dicluster domain-containing protein [Nitrospirota bacterium]